jgi:hypothetical protein
MSRYIIQFKVQYWKYDEYCTLNWILSLALEDLIAGYRKLVTVEVPFDIGIVPLVVIDRGMWLARLLFYLVRVCEVMVLPA